MPGGDARTRQFDNQSRAAQQILRLVDAGVQVDWLDGQDVIALLELRGKERGGLARATAQDWARQGIDCRELLRVYAPYGMFRSHLAWNVEHRPSPRTIVTALWRGVDVTNTEIVLAELGLLIRLWEEHDFTEDAAFAAGMLHLVRGLRDDSLDTAAAFFVATLEDGLRGARYIDGAPAAMADRDVQEFRAVTQVIDRMPVDGAAIDWVLVNAAQPGIADELVMADRKEGGAAALVERAYVIAALAQRAKAIDGANPSALGWADRVLKQYGLAGLEMPQSFTSIGDHASSCWRREEWDAHRLRIAAQHPDMRVAEKALPWTDSVEGYQPKGDRSWTLTNLTPGDLRALARRFPEHPAMTQLIRELDFPPLSWLLPRWRQEPWLSAVQEWQQQLPEARNLVSANTAIRNLEQLARDLEFPDHHVSREEQIKLKQAFERLIALID